MGLVSKYKSEQETKRWIAWAKSNLASTVLLDGEISADNVIAQSYSKNTNEEKYSYQNENLDYLQSVDLVEKVLRKFEILQFIAVVGAGYLDTPAAVRLQINDFKTLAIEVAQREISIVIVTSAMDGWLLIEPPPVVDKHHGLRCMAGGLLRNCIDNLKIMEPEGHIYLNR